MYICIYGMDTLVREMIISKMVKNFIVLLKMACSLTLGIAYLENILFNIFKMWLTITQIRGSKTVQDKGVATMKLPRLSFLNLT